MNPLYTVEQAAAMLGVTKQAITHHIRNKKITPARSGRKYLISLGQIQLLGKIKPGPQNHSKKLKKST